MVSIGFSFFRLFICPLRHAPVLRKGINQSAMGVFAFGNQIGSPLRELFEGLPNAIHF